MADDAQTAATDDRAFVLAEYHDAVARIEPPSPASPWQIIRGEPARPSWLGGGMDERGAWRNAAGNLRAWRDFLAAGRAAGGM